MNVRGGNSIMTMLNLTRHPSVVAHGKPVKWESDALMNAVVYRCDLRSQHETRNVLGDAKGPRPRKSRRIIAAGEKDPATLLDHAMCKLALQHFQEAAATGRTMYSCPNVSKQLAMSMIGAMEKQTENDPYFDEERNVAAGLMEDAKFICFFFTIVKTHLHREKSLVKEHAAWCDSINECIGCLLYTSPSPRDRQKSRMPSSA